MFWDQTETEVYITEWSVNSSWMCKKQTKFNSDFKMNHICEQLFKTKLQACLWQYWDNKSKRLITKETWCQMNKEDKWNQCKIHFLENVASSLPDRIVCVLNSVESTGCSSFNVGDLIVEHLHTRQRVSFTTARSSWRLIKLQRWGSVPHPIKQV